MNCVGDGISGENFIVFVMSKRHPSQSVSLDELSLTLFCCCRIRFDKSHSETELMKLHASDEEFLKMSCLKNFSSPSFFIQLKKLRDVLSVSFFLHSAVRRDKIIWFQDDIFSISHAAYF